jgi:TRAP-type C4-dicarboxylate transport system permease small subunit
MSPSNPAAKSWFDRLIDALAVLAGALTILLVVLIAVDVGLRWPRVLTLPWSLEATEYMLYAITFLGAPWVLREEGHIAIEIVVERLPGAWQRHVRRATDALGAVVCTVLFWYACRVLWRSYESGTMVQKSFVFPEWWAFALVPPVMLLLFAVYARWLLKPSSRAAAGRREGA